MDTQVIDFAPLIQQYVIPALGLVITTGISWLISKAAKFFNIRIDETQRAFVMSLVERGIAVGQHRIAQIAADKAHIETHNMIAAEAANYVIARAPDALKHFKLTPEDVRQIISAKLSEGVVAEAKTLATSTQGQ